MQKPKVLILVVCAVDKRGEYEMLADTIKDTWGRTETENAKIYYLWCKNYQKKHPNDWVLNKQEGYGMLLLKTLWFLKQHPQLEYDYVFRTNIGSYVHTERLVDWLQDCPREGFYSGVGGNCAGIDFASGSGFIFSKDLAQLAMQNSGAFGVDHIDDVSFGRFFTKFGVKRSKQCMRITNHNGGLILQVGDDVVPEPQFPYDKNYHWRLRANDGSRIIDANEMRRLYNQFNP